MRGVTVVDQRHEAFIDFIRAHAVMLGEGDIVATMHPNIMRYFLSAHVRVRALPIRRNVEESYREIEADGVTYLFCDKNVSLIWEYTQPVIRAHQSAFQLVAERRRVRSTGW